MLREKIIFIFFIFQIGKTTRRPPASVGSACYYSRELETLHVALALTRCQLQTNGQQRFVFKIIILEITRNNYGEFQEKKAVRAAARARL